MKEAAALMLLSVAAILLMGAFTRLKRIPLAALGPIVGLAAFTVIGSTLVVVAGHMVPAVTVAATAVIFAAIAIGRRRRPNRRTLAAIGLAIVGVAAVSAISVASAPARLTPDSLQYIAIADMISEPGGFDRIGQTTTVKRGLSTAVLHTLGSLDGLPYSASATPVMVSAGFATLTIVVWTALSDSGQTRTRKLIVVGATLAFVFSTNRAVYDAFYINSHGMVMTGFLVVVAGGFMALRDDGWLLAVALCAAMIVPSRPEGVLLVALGLLPILVHPNITRVEKALVTMPMALMSIVWFGIGLWSRAPGDRSLDPSDPVIGGLIIAIGLVALAALAGLVADKRLGAKLHIVPWVAVAALTGYLAISIQGRPELLGEAVAATARNVAGEGFWGVSWIVLIVLVAAAVFSDGFAGDGFFVLPLAGFAVMFWLLVYLRDGAYRVGAGDSGNRILAHIFLVAVAYVAISFGRASIDTDSERFSGPPARHEAAP